MKLKPMQFIEVRDIGHLKKIRSENECYFTEEEDVEEFNNGYEFFICDDEGDCFVSSYNSKQNLIEDGYTEVFDTPQKKRPKVFKNKYYIGDRVFGMIGDTIFEGVVISITETDYGITVISETGSCVKKENQIFKTKHQLKQSLLKEENKRHEEEIGRINNL